MIRLEKVKLGLVETSLISVRFLHHSIAHTQLVIALDIIKSYDSSINEV